MYQKCESRVYVSYLHSLATVLQSSVQELILDHNRRLHYLGCKIEKSGINLRTFRKKVFSPYVEEKSTRSTILS